MDTSQPLKVDVFVLGGGLLDRRQIDRRVRVAVPGSTDGIWVTSPEDQVLRKLDWYRKGGEVSDRQWRDVLGILSTVGHGFDREDLTETATHVGLADLLDAAWPRWLTAAGVGEFAGQPRRAQSMHRRVSGRAARRSSPIGRPHSSHVP